MEYYINNVTDITYMSELIPHLSPIQVFLIKSMNE